jgi:Cu+-exporting ATPase
VGTALGARHGLLIRGGDILERASTVDTVVLDKTGTITQGRPRVTRVRPAAPGGALGDDELLALAAAVERLSSHPLAKAVVTAADNRGASSLQVKEGTFVQQPGSGALATVDGKRVQVGSESWVASSGRAARRGELGAAHLGADLPAGHTLVYVAVDGRLVGALEVADEIRAEAAGTVARLQQMGIQVHVLSGDRPATVEAVASQLGVDVAYVHGGVRPEGKAAFVERLQKEGRTVAMVGDGVNDAAALAQAHVGIAMGGGVGAASEVASVVLLGDRLSQVVSGLELSKATLSKIKQNLVWAFAYNLVGIPLAAGAALPAFGVALTPSVAGALMGVSSLGVMGNSLLLRVTGGRMLEQVEEIGRHSVDHPNKQQV